MLETRPKTTKSEKHLLRSLQIIQNMCSRLFLQKIVVDTAQSILRSAMSIPFLAATLRKRRRAFLTATIVIASNRHSCARSLKEVSFATDTHWKSVAKCYSRVVDKLDLKITPQRPHEYVTRFCCLLRMSQAISQVAEQLASRYAISDSPHSAQPTAIAAAAILFISSMSKQRKEARQVAAIAFIPERLLLRLYADMYGKLNDLFTTEDLIDLQEHGLDMRKLLRPDVAGTWKTGSTHAVTQKRRRVDAISGPAVDQPREKVTRSNK